jgi:hypothetical protein
MFGIEVHIKTWPIGERTYRTRGWAALLDIIFQLSGQNTLF